MGEEALVHVCSPVGQFARLAAAFSWSPCRPGGNTTHRTKGLGRVTVGRMAAAAAMPGSLMMEPGCTPTSRLQRARVYVPLRAPSIQSVGLGVAAAVGLQAAATVGLQATATVGFPATATVGMPALCRANSREPTSGTGLPSCVRCRLQSGLQCGDRGLGNRLPRGGNMSAPDAGEGAGPKR